VGARPTRQALQPDATGAAMEVTKWLKPSAVGAVPIAAIVDGTAPATLTVTGLAKCLPYSWSEQEQSIGLLQ
jgi:hypothetical protein